jgi:hypothetical protein
MVQAFIDTEDQFMAIQERLAEDANATAGEAEVAPCLQEHGSAT